MWPWQRSFRRIAVAVWTRPRRVSETALVALALAAPLAARADAFHSQTLPLGQRAIGMGGAFVAVADDPSATYYNPAGVVWGSDATLSASLTLTAFDKSTVDRGYRTSVGESALNHQTGTSLPVFVSASKHLGKRQKDGRRHHAVALSSFTVSQRRLAFDTEVRGGANMAVETLSIDMAERTEWYGLSYAHRVTPNLSLGFSGFLSVARLHYEEERIGVGLTGQNPDGSFRSDRSSWTSHLVDTNVKSLVARFGGLYAIDERVRIGVMFQPPGIQLRGRASARERYLRNDLTQPEAQSEFFAASHGALGSDHPIPWELRGGVRYLVRDWMTLALDASVYGRSGRARDPVVAIGRRPSQPPAVRNLGAFIDESFHRTYNGNVSLGAAMVFAESIGVRCGIYTDLSSAPEIPRFATTYQAPDIHRVGGALSVGLVSDGYDMSLGIVGVYGRGSALSFNDDAGSEAMYARTKATDRMFFVFLNGVKNAVRTLAAKADEQIRRYREAYEREQEREASPEPPAPRR